MTLFDECIEALKREGEVIVLSEEESKEIEKEFEEIVPIHPTVAKVDFSKMLWKREIVVDEDILEELFKNNVNVNEPVYVFWDNVAYPTLKTSIKNVINAIDYVISVSFDTWIFCPKERYIVEYYHEGETFLGFY
ncbi:hypothetical protein CLV97_1281 [Planifilum fimeticola]|uniref:Uncharacterized protein n=1 Tax=Planifilum fimeticola TaxID=201975 RepID=A0A2T0LB82_9BACL|nr:hypothetical protein [Planifilum fimeticola]PRX39166.1 hypothetical protein CLV97_1281 [Planifilum fimeticola]